MNPGDLVIYHRANDGPRPARLVRFLSDKKAVIVLAGQERKVWISSLRAIVATR
jgi:hypothetical protein